MIIYKPNDTTIRLIALIMLTVIFLIMYLLQIDPYVGVLVSLTIVSCCLLVRSNYYRKINEKLTSDYINEYEDNATAIKYFRKTIYARRNKLAKKEIIHNDDLKQMPKLLQAKKINSKIADKITSNYVKLKILAPYMYEVKFVNLVLVTNVSGNEYDDYIKKVKKVHLEEGMENIILFYLENPSDDEYQKIKGEMKVNNYLVEGISVKTTFLVNNSNGFTLLDNYYFIDYSSDMIKEKYRIESNVPIPCDVLSKRVNNEISYKICGV
jgi:hypothetical protein